MLNYFSDWTESHYKSWKNFINTHGHKTDFWAEAEWQFFATSHMKGSPDGVGDSIKQLTEHASLQKPQDNQMLTPLDTDSWSKKNCKSTYFKYIQ